MARSKYHAKPEIVDGIRFASRKEAKRYGELKLLERGRRIFDLVLQPRFPLDVQGQHICTYIGDFRYQEGAKVICEDTKGFRTPEYKLKRKLFLVLYPSIEHREI